MKSDGVIKSHYPEFEKNEDLAELIGVTLGDGHVCKYERTEELRIVSNSKNLGFINRYASIVKKVFSKTPSIVKVKKENATKISLYEKRISTRLGISTGARGELNIKVPDWILRKKCYIVRYLRGLYEAEGSFCVHKPTCTYKFSFSNKNTSMLKNVFNLMKKLGFHPHESKYQIQISKKDEVCSAIELLQFRKY